MGAVDNQINTTSTSSTGNSTATSISGLTKGIRATKVDVDSNASILGQVHSDVTSSASTHSGGSATATANAERPNAAQPFGGEKVGVDAGNTASANGTLTVDGKVTSEFDVDASNDTGEATATATELQVTGVLATDLISHGELDVDGSATVKQDAKATTNSGGAATATVLSGPAFEKPGLDGITGVAVINDVDGKSDVDIDGKVDYTGTATAENSTGAATAKVSGGRNGVNNPESLQDMVGTLLVTSEDVKSGGDLTINGTSEANTTATASTHSNGAATAEVNADPVKGVKSNAGVTYQANEDLVVNGQATFTADVDANNSTGGATSTARLENAIGTDLSNLNSRNVENPNQLRAHATIDADGHATTDLNAKADTSTGSATASTVTQTQKGLVVDDNVCLLWAGFIWRFFL